METLGDLITDVMIGAISKEDLNKPIVMVDENDDLILAEIEVYDKYIKVKPVKDLIVF